MTEHQERIDLEAPLSGDFHAVVRLIIGGIAERVDFAFEEIDDLQLAVERLLVEAGTVGTVQLEFEVEQDGISTRVGPLSGRKVEFANLWSSHPPTAERVRRLRTTQTV